MRQVLSELLAPSARGHGGDCIATAIGTHSSFVPYLCIQKFVLGILCMDTVWSEIFTLR